MSSPNFSRRKSEEEPQVQLPTELIIQMRMVSLQTAAMVKDTDSDGVVEIAEKYLKFLCGVKL